MQGRVGSHVEPQALSLFFSIPPELRNKIYHLCAWSYLEVDGLVVDPESFLRDKHSTPIPDLLLTCKLIAREATAVLYSIARLRYVYSPGSVRVDLYAVGNFSPAAIHHLYLEIRPVIWQQACDNLARLVPMMQRLETLHICLSRAVGWERADSIRQPASRMAMSSTNSSMVAHSAWRAIKPMLMAAQAGRLTTLELSGQYGKRFAKLAREQLTLKVILGPAEAEYRLAEEEESRGHISLAKEGPTANDTDAASLSRRSPAGDNRGQSLSHQNSSNIAAANMSLASSKSLLLASHSREAATPAIAIRQPRKSSAGYP